MTVAGGVQSCKASSEATIVGEASEKKSSVKLTLLTLIPEIYEEIFDQLDPVDSTCLGLTCSQLYRIHRKRHGTVRLNKISLSPPHVLHQRLQSYFGPQYAFDYLLTKFVRAATLPWAHRSFLVRNVVDLYKQLEQTEVDIQKAWVFFEHSGIIVGTPRTTKVTNIKDGGLELETVEEVTEDSPTKKSVECKYLFGLIEKLGTLSSSIDVMLRRSSSGGLLLNEPTST